MVIVYKWSDLLGEIRTLENPNSARNVGMWDGIDAVYITA